MTGEVVWEYKVAGIDITGGTAAVVELNQLGDEGWELVQVLGDTTVTRKRVLCAFKRPKARRAG